MTEKSCNMIRKAERKDASRLAEILIFAKRKAYRPIFQNDRVSFNDMQVLELALFYRDKEKALDDIYVLDDGIVKGMMTWNCENSEDSWELKELYVDPFFQREGIGGLLMKRFLDEAAACRVREVFLWVLEENSFARGFYEKWGYVRSGEREEYPGTDKCLLRYNKRLDGKLEKD